MIKLFCTILILSISVFLLGTQHIDKIVQFREISSQALTRDSILVESENFENGLISWQTNDPTDPGTFWNVTSFNAFGDSGRSWRLADPNIPPDGGYMNGWYQVLDTPAITLPDTEELQLSFYQKRAIEAIGGVDDFDGWDGFNVRIRLADQDYPQAEILTDCDPAYNSNSLYSFGAEHGEDPDGVPGIPGWGGSTDWTFTSIGIPPVYQGKSVIISFAFAADPNTDTISNPEFTGIYLDNISIAEVFFHNGDHWGDFSGYTNTAIGGDLWHLENSTTAPSPSHFLACFDPDNNSYNSNMENYISGSLFTLPDSGNIYFDTMIKTELDDANFPQCDYFSIEVSYFDDGNWTNWNSISNPLGDPNLDNVVFTGTTNGWSKFSEGWAGYNDLSMLAGKSIKLRFGFHSNDSLNFQGIALDDIAIYNFSFPNIPPTNLCADLQISDYSVDLSWNVAGSHLALNYYIYRKEQMIYVLIDSVTSKYYSDLDPFYGQENSYKVSINYPDGETDLSSGTTIFVPEQTADLIYYDDLSSESGLPLQNLQCAAVHFISNGNQVGISHCRIFIKDTKNSPLVLKFWNDLFNPALSTITVPNLSLQTGWNTISIPEDIQDDFNTEFHIGIQQFANSPIIGVDEHNSGNSNIKNGDWQSFDTGNIMIQAITKPRNTFFKDNEISSSQCKISNYPNPFNPSTTIKLEFKEKVNCELLVFNIKGQLIKTIYKGIISTGEHNFVWNGIDNNGDQISTGFYICLVKTDKYCRSKKMLLLK